MSSAYFDIRWDQSQNDTDFQALLNKYFAKYVCGREITKNGILHYQLYADCSKNIFANFKAKVIKDWNLVGQTKTKGLRRQYGQIKDVIKSPDNMISYCLKDGNYTYKGYTKEYIDERYAQSYEKVDKNDKYDKFIKIMKDYMEKSPYVFNSRNEKLILTAKASQIYHELYDSYIPKYKAQTILLDLGIMTHMDYARSIFSQYIDKDNPPIEPTHVIHCDNCYQESTVTHPTPEQKHREEMIKSFIEREKYKYNIKQKELKDKFFS